MSEQEYIYEYGCERDQAGASRAADTGVEAIEIENLDTSEEQTLSRWPIRLLVVALLASFLLCLVALWFSGTLLGAPDQVLPDGFLQVIATHRLLVLLVPVACLIICYGMLRSFTRDIMAVPERYLDERQKMLHDQAHRSAFKIIRYACLLIPCGFLVPHLPWFNQPAPVNSVPVPIWFIPNQAHVSVLHADTIIKDFTLDWKSSFTWTDRLSIAPATTAEIVLAGVLFVLCLLLIVSALPMAVLAWKGKR